MVALSLLLVLYFLVDESDDHDDGLSLLLIFLLAVLWYVLSEDEDEDEDDDDDKDDDKDKDDEDKNEYEQRYRDDNNDFVIDIYILGMLSLYLIVLFVLHYIFTHIA